MANDGVLSQECGQSAAIRGEAADFWATVGGERIVIAHLAKYLNRNSVTNPHYATSKPSEHCWIGFYEYYLKHTPGAE